MKTTNLANISPKFLDQFVDFDDTFLRICILFVVGPDTVVGSASGNLLIVCTSDFFNATRAFVIIPRSHRFIEC